MEKLKPLYADKLDCVYVVEEGDTLKSIAEKFSTTENLIIVDNFLNSQLKIGDRLYVKSYQKTYVVTPCDSLENIALKFGTTKDEILKINKISYIYVGERIVIP